MARPLVALFATALLAACTPLAGLPGSSASLPAPTPATASNPVAPASAASAGPAGLRPAAPEGCTPTLTGDSGTGAMFVALADRGYDGVAFLLDASTGAVRGQINVGGAPEGAVDWVGKRLILFCSVGGVARLVGYDLFSLREHWRIPVEGRSITKAPGGLPAVAVGSDGRFVFVLHYKTLRPGDAYAPGTSLTWLTAHDARTGVEQGRIDFPDCVAARIFASDGAAYVMCRDQLYTIDPSNWSIARTFPYSGSVGPVGIVGDRAIYGVTRELQVLAMDLATGQTTRIGNSDTAARAQSWGRLTMTSTGLTLWVIARASSDRVEYDPDTLAVLSLHTWSVSETRVPGLRGVGLVGSRIVYGAGGTLRSTDGAIDKTLIDGRVEYWHILGAPSAGN
jgi:hypothetical protein